MTINRWVPVSRTFYANNRWFRRPGPWPGAGAVTPGRRFDMLLEARRASEELEIIPGLES